MNIIEKYLGLEQTEQDVWRSFFEGLIFESYDTQILESFNIKSSETIEENEFYNLKKEVHTFEATGEDMEMESAYSVIDDSYIGDIEMAKFLAEKEITAQAISENHKVASIGYSEKLESWYGWSHRAIFGFKEGMEVKKGDVAYVANSAEDFLDETINFFCDTDNHVVTKKELNVTDPNKDFEGEGVYIEYEFKNSKNETIKSSYFAPYPETFGKGEYTIENEDQAYLAAIDFANAVS